MAKRKKHRRASRRRHMSGLKGIDMQNTLGVVAGAVVAGYLNKVIPATVNDKLVAGGKVALGIALPHFIKSNRSLMTGIGAGMVAVGSVDLLKSFGALSGDFDIPVINGLEDEMGADVLSGDDIPVINGDVLAGDDELGYMALDAD